MLKPLFQFEEGLLRVEKWILVGCVLLMLALAGYTVFYRNVLIFVQNHLATSGPPVAEQVEKEEPVGAAEPGDEPAASDDQGFGGGFGGGFDGEEADEGVDEEDEAGGFGGGFGGGFDDEEEANEQDQSNEQDQPNEQDEADGFGGGFGGGFGDAEGDSDEASTGDVAAEDDSDGFGGGFGGGFGDGEEADQQADQPQADQQVDDQPAADAAKLPATGPVGGPPPEGSFAALVIELIDDVKFDWLDVLLRQLVIICGFLGGMLATRQRSHITVDAVGKLIKGRTEHIVHTITSFAAAVVCVFLAMSGWDLVEIGRQFPRQVIPWLKDWQFQLAFPVGWGLLAFHFLMRTIESATLAAQHSEAPTPDAEPHEEAL